mgnify:CR=1 FL=1
MIGRTPITHHGLFWLGLVLVLALGLAPPGHAEAGLPGDVNLDGVINVLDAQSAINMALGAADPTAEADVDADASVDVRDVQTVINTALGAGGLVQLVTGLLDLSTLPPGTEVRAVAVSTDGRTVEVLLDETGDFAMNLAVGPAWSLGFVASGGEGTGLAGTVVFPLRQGASGTLPLPNISSGTPIDLGQLDPVFAYPVETGLRTLLAEAARPIDWSDYNGNGVPDLLEDLFVPYLDGVSGFALELPDDLPVDELMAVLGPCLEAQSGELALPDLTGIEQNGIPRFLRPFFDCLQAALLQWLQDNTAWPQEMIALYAVLVEQGVAPQIRGWLEDLGRPELYDADGNGVPDYIEPAVCMTGVVPAPLSGLGECTLDADSDGVPGFLEDDDEDGVPNWLDVDAWTADDLDGDGVPNAADVDDDGDGMPDYADAAPSDATAW